MWGEFGLEDSADMEEDGVEEAIAVKAEAEVPFYSSKDDDSEDGAEKM